MNKNLFSVSRSFVFGPFSARSFGFSLFRFLGGGGGNSLVVQGAGRGEFGWLREGVGGEGAVGVK